jgi:hypothetical protein
MRYPEITVAECVRILRPGGVIVTQVDLRDHYNMAPERSADHLLFSDRLWKAMTWNRSAYTNRLRISDWRRLFAEQRLAIRELRIGKTEVLHELYRSDPRAKRYAEDDFVTTEFFAVLARD